MSFPKVSVIVPVYNVDEWLSDCLDSLLNQSMLAWEAILIDDASTDQSACIAQRYVQRDSRFRLIRHVYNKGLGESRNTGCQAAVGDFLFFLDPDDLLSRDTFFEMTECADKYHADMVVGDFYEFQDKIEILDIDNKFESRQVFRHYFNKLESGFLWTDVCDDYDLILAGIFFTTACGKLFRRERWNSLGCRVPSGLRMAEDFIPVKKFFFSGAKVAPIYHASLLYRKRIGSATTRRSRKAFEILKAYPLAMEMFRSLGVIDRLEESIDLFFIRAFRDHMIYLLPYRLWWSFYCQAAPLVGSMNYTLRVGYIDGLNLKRWKKSTVLGFLQILHFLLRKKITNLR